MFFRLVWPQNEKNTFFYQFGVLMVSGSLQQLDN